MNVSTKTNAAVGKAVMWGKPISWADLMPKSVMLMVQSKPTAKAPAMPAASAGRMRQIFIDGMLVEMDEQMIESLIRAGIFTVVYPGTNIPWDPDEDRHPNYPPDWLDI